MGLFGDLFEGVVEGEIEGKMMRREMQREQMAQNQMMERQQMAQNDAMRRSQMLEQELMEKDQLFRRRFNDFLVSEERYHNEIMINLSPEQRMNEQRKFEDRVNYIKQAEQERRMLLNELVTTKRNLASQSSMYNNNYSNNGYNNYSNYGNMGGGIFGSDPVTTMIEADVLGNIAGDLAGDLADDLFGNDNRW